MYQSHHLIQVFFKEKIMTEIYNRGWYLDCQLDFRHLGAISKQKLSVKHLSAGRWRSKRSFKLFYFFFLIIRTLEIFFLLRNENFFEKVHFCFLKKCICKERKPSLQLVQSNLKKEKGIFRVHFFQKCNFVISM